MKILWQMRNVRTRLQDAENEEAKHNVSTSIESTKSTGTGPLVSLANWKIVQPPEQRQLTPQGPIIDRAMLQN